jgi:hypothetical protein
MVNEFVDHGMVGQEGDDAHLATPSIGVSTAEAGTNRP